jgi:hypothetical protein
MCPVLHIIRVGGYVAQLTAGRTGPSNKTIRNRIVKANSSYSFDFERTDLRKKLRRPGVASWSSCTPVRGLRLLLCKEGRLVVSLAVPFCLFLRANANSVRWGSLYVPRALRGPLEGQVTISSTQQPELPKWQLSSAHTQLAKRSVATTAQESTDTIQRSSRKCVSVSANLPRRSPADSG